MKSIHLKIDYDEAISMKKDSLNLEKELLQTLVHIRAYDLLRKKEFILKGQIKKDLSTIESSLKQIAEYLPTEELKLIPRKREHRVQSQIQKPLALKPAVKKLDPKQSEVERELEDIKRKLAMLG